MIVEEERIRVLEGEWSPLSVAREIVAEGVQEDPFYVMDVGEVVARYNQWRELMPRVEPFYGELHHRPVIISSQRDVCRCESAHVCIMYAVPLLHITVNVIRADGYLFLFIYLFDSRLALKASKRFNFNWIKLIISFKKKTILVWTVLGPQR